MIYTGDGLRPLALILAATVGAPAQARPPYDPTPRIGILVPVGPPDYAVLLDALEHSTLVQDGPFTFRAATIHGVSVALIIQPTDGDLPRALGAQQMLQRFNIRALLYAGTSGGHMPAAAMGVGDVVLGAKNVNTANYYLSPSGTIQAGTFDAMQPTIRHYGALYMDPHLLAMVACATQTVTAVTTLPAWLSPAGDARTPRIFYYGTQGTSSIWSDNQSYTRAVQQVFHEVDEDGDWDSALVATLWHVPFLEVSVISNSIFAFPNRNHGTPAQPAGEPGSHIYAQRLSNRIALQLIATYGKALLTTTYTTHTDNPFGDAPFTTPTEPGNLLQGCSTTASHVN